MKKPKTMKIILLAAAVLTVVLFIMAVVMLKAVKGDALFYMDSGKGHFYAVSYRWVCLGEGLLILLWIILGVSKRKAILAKLPKVEWKKKESKAAVEIVEPKAATGAAAVTEVGAASEPEKHAEMKADVPGKSAVETQAVAEEKQATEAQVKTTAEPVRIQPAANAAEPVKRFCTSCGKQIPADAKFCSFCGAPTGQ